MEDRTEPDKATQDVEKSEAARAHEADRPATEVEQEEADDAFAKSDPDRRAEVAKHEKEMMEIGSSVKGEGEID
jgi:hypothetical protein